MTPDTESMRLEIKQLRSALQRANKERDDARAITHTARLVAIEAVGLAKDVAALAAATVPTDLIIGKIEALAAKLKLT